MATPVIGGLLSVLSSLLSACGGIYNEKLLKGRPSTSIHWQNIQMCVPRATVCAPSLPQCARPDLLVNASPGHRYIWGVAFNALGAWLKDGEAMAAHGILSGFSVSAWAVVLCNALNGLAISAVLKYADNIARVYAHAIAMMITMLVSTQLFKAPITPQLVLAAILVFTSTVQYNLPKELLRGMHAPHDLAPVVARSRAAYLFDSTISCPRTETGPRSLRCVRSCGASRVGGCRRG